MSLPERRIWDPVSRRVVPEDAFNFVSLSQGVIALAGGDWRLLDTWVETIMDATTTEPPLTGYAVVDVSLPDGRTVGLSVRRNGGAPAVDVRTVDELARLQAERRQLLADARAAAERLRSDSEYRDEVRRSSAQLAVEEACWGLDY